MVRHSLGFRIFFLTVCCPPPPRPPSQVALHTGHAWSERLLPRLLLAISPWLTVHVHNIRSFAQLMMYALLHEVPAGRRLWAHSAGVCVGGGGGNHSAGMYRGVEQSLSSYCVCGGRAFTQQLLCVGGAFTQLVKHGRNIKPVIPTP